MPTSVLTTKGQITIPKAVREALHIHAGDQIDFVLAPDGHVELRKHGGRVRELLGMAYRADLPDAQRSDDGFSESLAEDDERIRSRLDGSA